LVSLPYRSDSCLCQRPCFQTPAYLAPLRALLSHLLPPAPSPYPPPPTHPSLLPPAIPSLPPVGTGRLWPSCSDSEGAPRPVFGTPLPFLFPLTSSFSLAHGLCTWMRCWRFTNARLASGPPPLGSSCPGTSSFAPGWQPACTPHVASLQCLPPFSSLRFISSTRRSSYPPSRLARVGFCVLRLLGHSPAAPPLGTASILSPFGDRKLSITSWPFLSPFGNVLIAAPLGQSRCRPLTCGAPPPVPSAGTSNLFCFALRRCLLPQSLAHLLSFYLLASPLSWRVAAPPVCPSVLSRSHPTFYNGFQPHFCLPSACRPPFKTAAPGPLSRPRVYLPPPPFLAHITCPFPGPFFRANTFHSLGVPRLLPWFAACPRTSDFAPDPPVVPLHSSAQLHAPSIECRRLDNTSLELFCYLLAVGRSVAVGLFGRFGTP